MTLGTQAETEQGSDQRHPFVPYPPIEKHGVVGDRRTAALVAADGTVDWLCLPDYDGATLFGALLDSQRGGYWRFGPEETALGRQEYEDDTAVLRTLWTEPGYDLELTDAMALPEDERPEGKEDERVLLRRLRCMRGEASCLLDIRPRADFSDEVEVTPTDTGLRIRSGGHILDLWVSRPVQPDSVGASATFDLREGEEVWAVLSLGGQPEPWTVERAEGALRAVREFWEDRLGSLACSGLRSEKVRRSALAIYLLGYAPTGSVVAAPTTSLPERVGGHRNYDYRYAWVRDASLSMANLALLGDTDTAERYMGWLARLDSATDAPLQVAYRVCGSNDLPEHERRDLDGYRGSLPVRMGNRAARQRQLDVFGYLTDCALIYLQQGSSWYEECWETVRAAARYTAAHWREKDSGIWELPEEQHYVSSKVMSWVTLDRATAIAERTGCESEISGWREAMEEIHAEVMERGWSEEMGAFRQRYDVDGLDASALLIPVMGFLPADHPRVLSTVERIEERLAKDGLVHRFIPGETSGYPDTSLDEFEGAFLPCSFWLAAAHAKAGRGRDAEAILDRVESLAGDLGLFAEQADARTGAFLGNTPLVFSHAEYIRAVAALNEAVR